LRKQSDIFVEHPAKNCASHIHVFTDIFNYRKYFSTFIAAKASGHFTIGRSYY